MTTAYLVRADRESHLAEDAVETLEGCAWVIEKEGRLVGRIDVNHEGRQTARICSLLVDPAWYRSSALSRLVEMSRRYCAEHGPRRLLAEAGSAPGWMLAMLRRRGIPTVRPKPLAELVPSQADAGWREPPRPGDPTKAEIESTGSVELLV